MLNKILRPFLKSNAPAPSLPEGRRIYAIGDIHGRLDLLEDLLARIDADDAGRGPARTGLIFLGDLVDRGPDSAGVVELLRERMARGGDMRVLMGNHEEIFLRMLAGDEKATRLFTRIGGCETAYSYGCSPSEFDALHYHELPAALGALVPPDHRRFLEGFEDLIVEGDYAFVHAGVRPGSELEAQVQDDLRWIRDPFLDHGGRLAKMIVHGHTISDEVERRPHRIGIDTGAYATGRLTAIGLEGDRCWQIQAYIEPAERHASPQDGRFRLRRPARLM